MKDLRSVALYISPSLFCFGCFHVSQSFTLQEASLHPRSFCFQERGSFGGILRGGGRLRGIKSGRFQRIPAACTHLLGNLGEVLAKFASQHLEEGKGPHPHTSGLTKKIGRFTKGRANVGPY